MGRIPWSWSTRASACSRSAIRAASSHLQLHDPDADAHPRAQLGGVEGLGDVVVGAGAQAIDGVLAIGRAR